MVCSSFGGELKGRERKSSRPILHLAFLFLTNEKYVEQLSFVKV
jgi:hypothetical protein